MPEPCTCFAVTKAASARPSSGARVAMNLAKPRKSRLAIRVHVEPGNAPDKAMLQAVGVGFQRREFFERGHHDGRPGPARRQPPGPRRVRAYFPPTGGVGGTGSG